MYRSVLNSKKIKYAVLKDLVQPVMEGVKEVNCFISLNSVLKSFYGFKPDVVAESLQKAPKNALSSEIINIVAHYRHFFWSRFGVPSNYYIYYSLEMADYCVNINTDYKNDYYEKRNGVNPIKEYMIINEEIQNNLSLIQILTEFLPNIYFINTGSFEPSAFPQLMISKNKPRKDTFNLVFTNDSVDFQLVNNPRTAVINLNADSSKLLNQTNVIGRLVKSGKTKSDVVNNVSSNFYVPILAIAGCKKYNIKGMKGYANLSAAKKISKLIKEKKVIDVEYSTMDAFKEFLGEEHSELLDNNFKILSLKNIANNITNQEFIKLKKQINNKSDNFSLMEINGQYYEKNPLMLIELMEGEY